MSESIFYAVMGVLGLFFGSFAGATVWRLRATQLIADKSAGEDVDIAELKRLRSLSSGAFRANDRSRCLSCGHTLAWYDLLPLVSWVSTRGKCRYCGNNIGRFEPAIELGSAALFVSFALYWTQAHSIAATWPLLIVWVLALLCLVILFAYDQKWFILPDLVMWPFIGLGAIVALATISNATSPLDALVSTVGAVLILAGLYLMLWLVSKGQWVGFGDVKLGLGLGLLLGSWQLAFLTLFMANFLGTLIVLPGLLTGKLNRKAHIPFGPLLILGFFIALFFGSLLIDLFYSLVGNSLMLY